MIGSGVFEVEIENEKIGFQFGMLASAYTEQIAGMDIFQVFKEIATGHGTLQILQYFYGGAVAYNGFHGIDKKVTIADVSTWIEKMGLEKSMEIYAKSIGAHQPKNGLAPKETGQSMEA